MKDYEAERIGLPAVDSISMAGYITGKVATSPRKVLPLGQPDGWRDIWGGPTRYPVVNGIIVDKRDEAATADPADGSGAGKLWKLMTGDEAMNVRVDQPWWLVHLSCTDGMTWCTSTIPPRTLMRRNEVHTESHQRLGLADDARSGGPRGRGPYRIGAEEGRERTCGCEPEST